MAEATSGGQFQRLGVLIQFYEDADDGVIWQNVREYKGTNVIRSNPSFTYEAYAANKIHVF